MFTHAIVRPPSRNFAAGLTSATLGAPDYEKALAQHAAYCAALASCGLTVTALDPDPQHPDATFIEDAAVIARSTAILTRPGASSRAGEVAGLRAPLARFFQDVREISAPGTLDGGDVCEAGNHFFIGVSRRTNESGAGQLAEILARQGCTSTFVDIRAMNSILHLKSGIAFLGDSHLVVMEEMAARNEFCGFHLIPVAPAETYAANCVQVNASVLIPAGFPHIAAALQRLGYSLLPLDMSEFQKMDGGLSCLSLRFP